MSIKAQRILYVSYRMPFPFFVGGDGLVAHFILEGSAKFFNSTCFSLGVISPPVFPTPMSRIKTTFRRLGIVYDFNSEPGYSKILFSLPYYNSVMVSQEFLLYELEKQIKQFGPTIIITAEENCQLIAELARSHKIPVVLRVNHAFWGYDELTIAAKHADTVIFVSEYIRNKYRHIVSGDVVYPIYDWEKWLVNRKSEKFISMLNPVPEKGGDLFFEIVKSLPQTLFLAQEGWYQPKVKWGEYGNLSWRPRKLWNITKNMGMNYFFAHSKLVLVPSQCEDAMPGIVIQSLKNGVPIIGSQVGGITEQLIDSGTLIQDYSDINQWLSVIHEIDNNPNYRKQLSMRSKLAGKKYDYFGELHKLHNIFSKIT